MNKKFSFVLVSVQDAIAGSYGNCTIGLKEFGKLFFRVVMSSYIHQYMIDPLSPHFLKHLLLLFFF